jgi:hypothetical protein
MAGPRSPRPDGGSTPPLGPRAGAAASRLAGAGAAGPAVSGKVRLRGKGASALVDLSELQFDAASGAYLYRGRPIDEGQIAWENESQKQAVRANAVEMDPGLEDDAASPEGTPLEQRTVPAGGPQVFKQEDILRTIDQVHDNASALVERMVRDSTMATGNPPRVRSKFAGKTLDPKTASEQFIAAAIDLRREMAKPAPDTGAAWKHTQKLLGLMRGKDWAKELIPGFDRAAAIADVDPEAAGRIERAAMQGDFVTDPDAPRQRLDPDSLISEEVAPVPTPVIRGPGERRNASGQQQYDAVESARKLFDDRLDALRRTIRGTFQGEALNATDATTLAKLNQIVSENIGAESSRLGIGAGDSGGSPQSPAAAVAAIEQHLNRSAPAGNQRTSVFPTAPAGEVLARSAPTRAPSDAVPRPGPNTVDPKAHEKANEFSQRLSRLLGEELGDPFVPSQRPPKPADVGAPPEWTEERASAWRASEGQRQADMEAAQPARRVAGTVQRPEVIRQRLAELNERPAEPEQQPRLGYETVNPDARLAPAIEDRIGNRTRDPIPESSPQEISDITRYRVRLIGLPQRPAGGQPLQSTNKPMLVRMIPKRDGSGRWEDMSPLPASVIRYGDRLLLIGKEGSTFTVDASGVAEDGAVPQRISTADARAIVASARPEVLQTPSDVDRAYELYNNRRRQQDGDWISMFQAERSQPRPAEPTLTDGGTMERAAKNIGNRIKTLRGDVTRWVGENVKPNSQLATVLRALGIDRMLMESQPGTIRVPGEPTPNRGVAVAETNRVTEEAAGAAATELVRALRANPNRPAVEPENLATVLSYLEANPKARLEDLVAGPAATNRMTEVRAQREAIQNDARLTESEKAERLSDMAVAEFEARYPQQSLARLKELLASPGSVSTILSPVLDAGRNVDAATPMTLYAVDWLKRNNPSVFKGPESDVRSSIASQIERVVADQYFRESPDMTGQRQGAGPQASAWKARMKEEMARQGIGNLAIFGDLEDRVNLQLQSSNFDPMSMSAGESAGLAGARGGMGPDRRRKSGPRPDIDDNPELGMIERPDSAPTGLMSDESASSRQRSSVGGLTDDTRQLDTDRPDAPTDTPTQFRASPGYMKLLGDAQLLAAEMGLPDAQITGDLSTLVPAMEGRFAELRSQTGSDVADRLRQKRVDAFERRMQRLNQASAAMVPRDDSSAPGSFASLFGNDDQRRAFASTLFRGGSEDLENNMRMLYLNWINNPMARNAIDRDGRAGVNPFFAAPRQVLDGSDLGAYESANVEWFFSRLADLENERRSLAPTLMGDTLDRQLNPGDRAIPDDIARSRTQERLNNIDSEIAALKDSYPGVLESYQQFKDEMGSVFRREIGELSATAPAGAQVGQPTGFGAVREFFAPQGQGSRTPVGDLFRPPMNRVAEPDRKTRVAELQAFLQTIDDTAGNIRGAFPDSVTQPEQSLLRFIAANPEGKLNADEIASLQRLVRGEQVDISPDTLQKLEQAGIFGEAILRRDKTRSLGRGLFPQDRLGGVAREQEIPVGAQVPARSALGSTPDIDPEPPASQLRRIQELEATLEFARTPQERLRVLQQLQQAQANANVVDTQATPTLSTVDRAERSGLPVSGVEAVDRRMRDISELAQMVRDLENRSSPVNYDVTPSGPVVLPRGRGELSRKAGEAVGPLNELELDENTLTPLPDQLTGSGFYVDPNSQGGRLVESLAGMRRPVTAGELLAQRGAAPAPRSPVDSATVALQGLANLKGKDGRPMGVDISPFSPDDPDLAQQLSRMADEFERMASSGEGQLPNRYMDDNSEQLAAVARAYRTAAQTVNQASIDTRPQRGVVGDAAPGVGLEGQASEAQPRVYLGGGQPLSGQPASRPPAFFRNRDGTTFLKVTAEDGGAGRPLFVPVNTDRDVNFRVNEQGRLVPYRAGQDPRLEQAAPIPESEPKRQRTPAGDERGYEEYWIEQGWIAPGERAAPETQTGDEFYDNAPANRMDDELGSAALPAMGGMALNQPAGDTNTYVNDPETVLRRLRQTVRPVAGLV